MTHAGGKSVAMTNLPLYAYVLDHEPAEHGALRRLREATQEMEHAFMQITPEQGHFLAFLLKLLTAQRVLELGTFTGYSALAMALALPENGRVVTCDVNEQYVAMAKQYWEEADVGDRIEVRIGPALRTLDALDKSGSVDTFDAVFIDADKDNYTLYYEAALRLVRRGGVVILDNMLRLGRVIDTAARDPGTIAIRALNDRIAHDERVDRVLLPLGDGLTLVRRR
jgi:predicted O-methyltransferase YrrM